LDGNGVEVRHNPQIKGLSNQTFFLGGGAEVTVEQIENTRISETVKKNRSIPPKISSAAVIILTVEFNA
jgi:hypothetical protein